MMWGEATRYILCRMDGNWVVCQQPSNSEAECSSLVQAAAAQATFTMERHCVCAFAKGYLQTGP